MWRKTAMTIFEEKKILETLSNIWNYYLCENKTVFRSFILFVLASPFVIPKVIKIRYFASCNLYSFLTFQWIAFSSSFYAILLQKFWIMNLNLFFQKRMYFLHNYKHDFSLRIIFQVVLRIVLLFTQCYIHNQYHSRYIISTFLIFSDVFVLSLELFLSWVF